MFMFMFMFTMFIIIIMQVPARVDHDLHAGLDELLRVIRDIRGGDGLPQHLCETCETFARSSRG